MKFIVYSECNEDYMDEIDINSLEEMMSLVRKHGEIELCDGVITIYGECE